MVQWCPKFNYAPMLESLQWRGHVKNLKWKRARKPNRVFLMQVRLCLVNSQPKKFKIYLNQFVYIAKRSFVLAVSLQNGFVYLLKSFDDVSPCHINTGLNGKLGMEMEWSNSREILAVAGTLQQPSHLSTNSNDQPIYMNHLKFYSELGVPLYTIKIPNITSPVSALTWGHNDKRLFIATGTQVHIAWVSRRVASLQLLCRLQIQKCIGTELAVPRLPLPLKMKSVIGHLFAQTIRVKYINHSTDRNKIQFFLIFMSH